MNLYEIKTTVVENAALGRARRKRARDLIRQARKMTRPRLTDEDRDKIRELRGTHQVGPRASDESKARAREVRKFDRPDPGCPEKRLALASRLRAYAIDVREHGAIGRRYLHLIYCYLKGRTYRQVEQKVLTDPVSKKEVNKPVISNLLRAIRPEWGLSKVDVRDVDGDLIAREMPDRTDLAMWLDKGNLDRFEVRLMLMAGEEKKAKKTVKAKDKVEPKASVSVHTL